MLNRDNGSSTTFENTSFNLFKKSFTFKKHRIAKFGWAWLMKIMCGLARNEKHLSVQISSPWKPWIFFNLKQEVYYSWRKGPTLHQNTPHHFSLTSRVHISKISTVKTFYIATPAQPFYITYFLPSTKNLKIKSSFLARTKSSEKCKQCQLKGNFSDKLFLVLWNCRSVYKPYGNLTLDILTSNHLF